MMEETPREQEENLMSKIANQDLDVVNRSARLYCLKKDDSYLTVVAEYLLVCLTPDEEAQVMWWWNEGTRDYATDMGHLEDMKALLLERKVQLQQ